MCLAAIFLQNYSNLAPLIYFDIELLDYQNAFFDHLPATTKKKPKKREKINQIKSNPIETVYVYQRYSILFLLLLHSLRIVNIYLSIYSQQQYLNQGIFFPHSYLSLLEH